jgi:hypothetical protein
MTRIRNSLALAVGAVLVLEGCSGSAVLIARNATGGVLGLDGDREAALGDARRQMSELCGGAYTLVGERNVVAGTFRGRTIAEYQIRYRCGTHPEQQITPTPEPPAPEAP